MSLFLQRIMPTMSCKRMALLTPRWCYRKLGESYESIARRMLQSIAIGRIASG